MNKSTVKKIVEGYKLKKMKFRYNGSRNQIEEFEGTIENTYNSIFTIRTESTNTLKSFSYNDIINKNLQIFL